MHQLTDRIAGAFGTAGTARAEGQRVVSFGFKYGIPVDADFVADMRFLPNPYWIPELRPHTGRDPDGRDYVLGQPAAEEFLERYLALLESVGPGYLREGKRFMTVAVGCTGGKHRSVAMTEEIARRLPSAATTSGPRTATWGASDGDLGAPATCAQRRWSPGRRPRPRRPAPSGAASTSWSSTT